MGKENKINYEVLEEITVKSQEELDMIPDGFKGRIYIEFGIRLNRAVLTRTFPRRVVARENASVVALENASIEAWDNASIEALGNASVVVQDNASVVAMGNASVLAMGNVSVLAMENVSVLAWENASIEALGNASVVVRDNASVVAGGNVQVVEGSERARIQISGNARIVYYPKNIEDFMNFYGIKHDKKTAIFYKAVHRVPNTCRDTNMQDGSEIKRVLPDYRYVSDHDDNFEYFMGEVIQEHCDQDVTKDCSYGIHISHMNWALRFGGGWKDLAIIEVETKINDVVLPRNTDGNVRTSEVKVLREVPLQECGVFGKILAKRRGI